MRAGVARQVACAASSRRVASTLAMNSGLRSFCPMVAIASACQADIFFEAASSVAWPRTAWRSASAMRGAVWVTSSPSTRIASKVSISRSDGVRAAPVRRIPSARASSAASVPSMPVE